MKKTAELIKNISEGKNLSFEESKSIFLSIMSGDLGDDLIFGKAYITDGDTIKINDFISSKHTRISFRL